MRPMLIPRSAPSSSEPTLTAQVAHAGPAPPSTYRTLGRFCGPILLPCSPDRPTESAHVPTATRRGVEILGRLGRLGRFRRHIRPGQMILALPQIWWIGPPVTLRVARESLP